MRALPPAMPVSRTDSLAPARPQTYSQARTGHQTSQTTVAPAIVQTVAVEPVVTRSDLLAEVEQWTWAEFRDYVVGEITARFGAFPRDSRKEYGIFNRYFGEYGTNGIAVARYAFGPVCDGWWGNAPISVNRFCRASDPYFTQPILARLADTGGLTGS